MIGSSQVGGLAIALAFGVAIGACAVPVVAGRTSAPESPSPAASAAPSAAASAPVRRDPERATELNGALLAATRRNDVATVRALIAAGADVNLKDETNEGAFLIAAAAGHLEIVRLALAAGADVRSTGAFGGSALIPAAHHGHVEVVHELLRTAVPVNQVNNLGWTALLETVILGDGGPAHLEIARALLDAGADVNLADRARVTPLAHARMRGHLAIAALLERAGGR